MAPRTKSSPKDSEFRNSLYWAARSLEWFLPQNEEEVAASEAQVRAFDYDDPDDPFEALDREPHFSKRPAAEVPTAHEYEQELRRAARLGKGKVPEEIEGRMRRDRQRAESEDGV
jgi:hypothetical protein